MKRIAVLGCLVMAGISTEAIGGCDASTRLNQTGIINALQGNTVCGVPGANYTGSPNDRWQEGHIAGGSLNDYKRGPTDKVDPTQVVGNWSTQGSGRTATITYNYTGGSSFTYSVHDNGNGTYSFCDGTNEIVNATVVPGTLVGCGFP